MCVPVCMYFYLSEQYCAAGMLMGLPLSIHRKSYWPVTLAAVAGTAADFMDVSAITITYRRCNNKTYGDLPSLCTSSVKKNLCGGWSIETIAKP